MTRTLRAGAAIGALLAVVLVLGCSRSETGGGPPAAPGQPRPASGGGTPGSGTAASFEPTPVPESARKGGVDSAGFAVGSYNKATDRISVVDPAITDGLGEYAGEQDLSDPAGREALVREFVEAVGEEEARWRGIRIYDDEGCEYVWPPADDQEQAP